MTAPEPPPEAEPTSRTLPVPRGTEFLFEELTSQLDRTRRLLTSSPEDAAEAALERVRSEADIETRIAAELTMTAPLAQPDHFPQAHRLVMRALEVLDREGSREPQVRGLGPLNPVAAWAVALVTEYIVKSYAEGVVGRLRTLYIRREAQCPRELPERRLLSQARVETDRVAPGFSGGGIAAPVLVAGGLALPALASLSSYLGAIDFGDRRVAFAGLAILFVFVFALSSALLRGAAVARRRCRLVMHQPLAALWETIGHAGAPPEDDSVLFGTVAVVLTALLWFVLPGVAAAFYFFL